MFTGQNAISLWNEQPENASGGVAVNDVHSRLNETRVQRVVRPCTIEALQTALREARIEGRAVSIAGGRHAMGGQQFGSDTLLVDTSGLNRVLSFEPARGLIEVQAGIRWPELLDFLSRAQHRRRPQWGIRQKQTGADRLSIGGALSANAHGRGLKMKPMIEDIESFTLVDANGKLLTCNRHETAELFRSAIGGYGLFGVIATVKLRLTARTKVERVVEIIGIEDLVPAVEQRISDGFLYGDFQFSIDSKSNDFLRVGVFSCYRPVNSQAKIPRCQKQLREKDWIHLFYLAHQDKQRAFGLYSNYYLSTNGQKYWSDTHQLSEYFDDYHGRLDKWLGPSGTGTEMITEIYVPRQSLAPFMKNARDDLRESGADLIYGTIRFIEKDDESFLPWAKERYACVIFNLHTAHNREALDKTAEDFRRLIDRAIHYGGSYYLTYHRWATRRQVESCYPQFVEFLKLKRKFDPEECFQSEWYRHYKAMFADRL